MIVNRVASMAPRLIRVEITGLVVALFVRSNSGLTIWTAAIDFNDYGRLTGRYWMKSENAQSPIPRFVADAIQQEVQ